MKVDIGKAYNMAEWEPVLTTLHLKNFPTVWVNQIKVCISNASFALLINGHLTS